MPKGQIAHNHKKPPPPGSQYELSKLRIALTEERVDLAYRGLVASLSKAEIKKCLMAKFGLGWRSCEDIISAAIRRRALDVNQGGDPEVSRGEALAFEPANSASERALRHAVTWRKLSFGPQSEAGSRFVETLLTIIETCRPQNRSVFDFVTQAVAAHFASQSAPSLLPRA